MATRRTCEGISAMMLALHLYLFVRLPACAFFHLPNVYVSVFLLGLTCLPVRAFPAPLLSVYCFRVMVMMKGGGV